MLGTPSISKLPPQSHSIPRLRFFQVSRVAYSLLEAIDVTISYDISLPHLVFGIFAYTFNFTLLLFLDVHWRDIMNASHSKQSRRNWAGFVLVNVIFCCVVAGSEWRAGIGVIHLVWLLFAVLSV